MESITVEQLPSIADLQAALNRAMEANARLERKLRAKAGGMIKVSEKGAVSVYGLGKFPVTLYAGQWQALFDRQEDIKEFILDNAELLATKA